MKYKLIITDFDGTMAENAIVPEPTVQAIKEYVKRGGKFVISTGRAEGSIKKVIDRYGLPTLAASQQGTKIMDTATGEVISNNGMDWQTALYVAERLIDKDPVIVYYGNDMYYNKECRYSDRLNPSCNGHLAEDILQVIKSKKENVNRIVLSTEEEKVAGYLEELGKLFEGKVLVNSGARYIIEFISLEHNKRESVEILSKHFNIPYDQIMTVGDSTNDIPLLDGPWHGVAVGSAHPKLKEVADEVTVPLNEHPIKHLIEKYCLD